MKNSWFKFLTYYYDDDDDDNDDDNDDDDDDDVFISSARHTVFLQRRVRFTKPRACKNVNVICLPTDWPRSSEELVQKCPCIPDWIGIWKCWFLRRGENRSTRRKTSRSRVENQQQTQPTCDAGSGSRTRVALVGGERSHHCAIPAACWWYELYATLTTFFPIWTFITS